MKRQSNIRSIPVLTAATLLASGIASTAQATEIVHAQLMLEKYGEAHEVSVHLSVRGEGNDIDLGIELETGFGRTIDPIRDAHAIIRGDWTVDPAPLDAARANQLTFKMKDFDNSAYRYKFAVIPIAENMTPASAVVRLKNLRRDPRVLNSDPNRLYDITIPTQDPGSRNSGHMAAMPVIPLTANQRHEYDIAMGYTENEAPTCKMRTLAQSGLLSQPTIENNVLEITDDCKMIWDTTGATVGSRYAVQFEVFNEAGHPRVVEQQILIVDSLEGICEGPTHVKHVAWPSGPLWSTQDIPLPVQGERVQGTFGYPQVDTNWVQKDRGNFTETTQLKKETPYTVDANEGVFLTGFFAASVNRHPELAVSVCPMIFDRTCKEFGPGYQADIDRDLVCFENDNCPEHANPDQADLDGDGLGDACDDDMDGDGVPNAQDQCAASPSPDTVMVADGCTLDDTCPCGEGLFAEWARDSCVRQNSLQLVFQRKISWFTYFQTVFNSGSQCG